MTVTVLILHGRRERWKYEATWAGSSVVRAIVESKDSQIGKIRLAD